MISINIVFNLDTNLILPSDIPQVRVLIQSLPNWRADGSSIAHSRINCISCERQQTRACSGTVNDHDDLGWQNLFVVDVYADDVCPPPNVVC